MARGVEYHYLLCWLEMDGTTTVADISFKSKIGIHNMRGQQESLTNMVARSLGRPIRNVLSFSYYGSTGRA